MELKLVYRALRKISDWTLSGYYSEVCVEGQEHVPQYGPLIIASSHHNEIIDIATLAVTIPYRRSVGFWAKSTLFRNPLARAILVSSGSIPVQRNPNSTNGSRSTEGDPASVQAALFRATSLALAKGEAVGVFPEGSSCTEPSIALLRDGAAWSAVEYAKWEHGQRKTQNSGDLTRKTKPKGLVIIPVGIVYTRKMQFQSRVHVRYGKPVRIDDYSEGLLSADRSEATSRIIVKMVTADVEKQLLDLTVNAPDWDTVYSAQMAIDILWGDERNVALKYYPKVAQTLSDLFTVSPSSPASISELQSRAKTSLVNYYSILHYSGISHSSLASLHFSPMPTFPSIGCAFATFFYQLANTILHPRGLLFLPILPLHVPAYVLGSVAGRLFPHPREMEAFAQYKAIFGGVGLGLSYAGAAWRLVHWLKRTGRGDIIVPSAASGFLASIGGILNNIGALDVPRRIGTLLIRADDGLIGKMRRGLVTFGIMYTTAWALAHWHNALVGGNYRQVKRLLASFKVLVGLLAPHSLDLSDRELSPFGHPPPHLGNRMIKRRYPAAAGTTHTPGSTDTRPRTPSVGFWRLIRHLLRARLNATVALQEYLEAMQEVGLDSGPMVEFLRNEGALVR